jgi:UDP-N-acetylmuramyl pentapeptide phosphotransferase/UDP-N-acetylglucosamine-1-phosphate transferase
MDSGEVMIIAFFISFVLTMVVILLPKNWVTDLDDLTGIQKFHHQPTPRIAGIPVFMSFLLDFGILTYKR